MVVTSNDVAAERCLLPVRILSVKRRIVLFARGGNCPAGRRAAARLCGFVWGDVRNGVVVVGVLSLPAR